MIFSGMGKARRLPAELRCNRDAYDEKANDLAILFIKNFEQYAPYCNSAIISAAPNVVVTT